MTPGVMAATKLVNHAAVPSIWQEMGQRWRQRRWARNGEGLTIKEKEKETCPAAEGHPAAVRRVKSEQDQEPTTLRSLGCLQRVRVRGGGSFGEIQLSFGVPWITIQPLI